MSMSRGAHTKKSRAHIDDSWCTFCPGAQIIYTIESRDVYV